MGEKTRFYHIFAAFLVVVFLFLNVYSLWFGAKNTGDIITITDSFTLSSDKTGTSVYLSDSLKEKGDIGIYCEGEKPFMAIRVVTRKDVEGKTKKLTFIVKADTGEIVEFPDDEVKK